MMQKGVIPNLPEDAPSRLKILLGQFVHKEKGVLTDEYSQLYNKKKYAFMLESNFYISHKCCDEMKKKPIKKYAKETGRNPIIATMASESKLRTQDWIVHGCNGFDRKEPISKPISFWTEQDVLEYIREYKIPICSVYGDVVIDYEAQGQLEGQMRIDELEDASEYGLFDMERPLLKTTGCDRTGCVLCGFGCHLEKEDNARFLRLKETHPKFHNLLYILKNNGVTYAEAIDWINEHGNLNIKY